MKEIWKDIPGYEGQYKASSLGNIKSLKFIKPQLLKQWIRKEYYSVGLMKETRSIISVHQLIAMTFLGHVRCGLSLVIDHINNDKLDNRVENLRIVTQRENSNHEHRNVTSKYTGVSWCKKSKKWQSKIYINKILIHLGVFTDELEAHNAYQNRLNQL